MSIALACRVIRTVVALALGCAALPASAQSSLWVEPDMVADSTAKFLAGRAEDEISVFANELFLRRLCAPQWAAHVVSIAPLFPTTCGLVSRGGEGVHEPLALGVLKRALELDIASIPEALARRIDTSQTASPRPPAVVRRTVIALDLAQALVRAARDEGNAWTALTHPDAVLRRAYTDDRDADPEREDLLWRGLRCGLALLAEQRAHLMGSAQGFEKSVRALEAARAMPEACARAFAAQTSALSLSDFTEASDRLARALSRLEELDALGTKHPGSVDSAMVVSVSLHVAEALFSMSCECIEGYDLAACTTGASAVSDAFRAYEHIARTDYAAAMALLLSSKTLWQTLRTLVRPRDACHGDVGSWACADQVRASTRARVYLALVADIATAKDGEAVQASFERFSEPIGSWRRKHETILGVTLQGYAGIASAWERTERGARDGVALGPTFSVGLQAHWTPRIRARYFLYAPLVDVGNVVSVRLASPGQERLTEVRATPDITWAQLFSPGLFVGSSVGRSPIDLALGVSYVPSLRERDDDGADVAVLRFGGFIAVDISLMPIL